MVNVKDILSVFKANKVPPVPGLFYLDTLNSDITKSNSDTYANLQSDEKLLLAYGSAKYKWVAKQSFLFCISDKYVHIAHPEKPEKHSFRLTDIDTIELGEIHHTTGKNRKYEGTDLLINGKITGRIYCYSLYNSLHHKNPPKKQDNTPKEAEPSRFEKLLDTVFDGIDIKTPDVMIFDEDYFITHLFAAMSGKITLEELDNKLKYWKNAPEKQISPYMSYLLFLFINIIFLGLPHLLQMLLIRSDINTIASKYDEDETTSCFLSLLLGIPTLGIYWLIWRKRLLERIEKELKRRNLEYANHFSAKDVWNHSVWGVLYFLGPFIYICKMRKAMNFLIADYNRRG